MICLSKIKGTKYTVNEMLCLKFFTDTNELQSRLRRAHWTAATLKVRKSYYQWAMGLYQTHLYHAKPIPTASDTSWKPCRLFHGLNRWFTVSDELPVYYGPFSTTIVKDVASTFCNERGLIWLIQSSYANPLKLVTGINVNWISRYKHEREVLLYNQCLPIEKTETFDDDSDILMNHFIHSLISRESPIIKKNIFYKQLGISFHAEWMHSICEHELLFEVTKCNGMRVFDRLVVELEKISPKMMDLVLDGKRNDKSNLEFLVEDLKAKHFLDHYRVFTSKFKVDEHPLLECAWFNSALDSVMNGFLERNSRVNAPFGVADDDVSCFVETQYLFDGVDVSLKSDVIRSCVKVISAKNAKLFGVREVILQRFDIKTSYAFIDLIQIDEFGVISLGFNAESEMLNDNGNWTPGLSPGTPGDVRDVRNYEKCVKSENEPFSILNENEHDISEYDFIVKVGTEHDFGNEFLLKRFHFENVNEFRVSTDLLVAGSITADAVHIYAKPKGKDVELCCIKTIVNPYDFLLCGQYNLIQQQAVSIDKMMHVRPFSDGNNLGGKVVIVTRSKILISESGGINANECGMNKISKYPNIAALKYGEFIGDSEPSNEIEIQCNSNDAGGGIICFMAAGNVVNSGSLVCRTSDNEMFSGGTVRIVTEGVFENQGIIDADKDGMVHIECAHFVNNGHIGPAPNVMIRSSGWLMPIIEAVISTTGKEQMTLEYVDHREHDESRHGHPENLLEEGTEDRYVSKDTFDDGEPPVGDWIVFRLRNGQRVFPKKIAIRNYSRKSGLKSVSIQGSVDDKQFEEWIVINDIHRRNRDLQMFDINPMEGLIAWRRRFKFFRIEVLENGGYDRFTVFFEFRIYGIRLC